MGFSGWMGRGIRLQAGISTTCLISFILFGYDQGVFSGLLEDENWKRQFSYPDAVRTGIIVSSYVLGCIGGCAGEDFLLPEQPDEHADWASKLSCGRVSRTAQTHFHFHDIDHHRSCYSSIIIPSDTTFHRSCYHWVWNGDRDLDSPSIVGSSCGLPNPFEVLTLL